MAFNFGLTPKTTADPKAATPSLTTGFTLTGSGDQKTDQNKPAVSLFALPTGGAPKTAAPAFSFNTPVASSTPSLSFGLPPTSKPATSAPPLTFGSNLLSLTTTTSTTTFTPILGTSTTASSAIKTTSAPSSITTSAAAPKLSFGLPSSAPTPASSTTSTAAPKLSFGVAPTTTSATPTLTLGSATTTAPTLAQSTTSTTSIATTTSTTSATAPSGSVTFGQLEDLINKWTIDLEEQGKFFINQAKQLNAWDSLLISNGEKILNLNGSIERVKQQQTQLDQELDFVLAQQKELEELITPLEKELSDIPVADIDRNQMYQMSEIIDSQLKQMSDDLKEIIEHINESHKDEELSNPITQISRILNAHMNSLEWIDRNTSQISSQLDQINKMQDMNRRNLSHNNPYKNF